MTSRNNFFHSAMMECKCTNLLLHSICSEGSCEYRIPCKQMYKSHEVYSETFIDDHPIMRVRLVRSSFFPVHMSHIASSCRQPLRQCLRLCLTCRLFQGKQTLPRDVYLATCSKRTKTETYGLISDPILRPADKSAFLCDGTRG